jgi:biopolymer transport protein ExbD
MKKTVTLVIAMTFLCISYGQTINVKLPTVNANVNKTTKPKLANTTVDNQGNYREKVDVKTNKSYTSAEGKVFDVYENNKGKLYIITGISEKTGKPKKKYLIMQ